MEWMLVVVSIISLFIEQCFSQTVLKKRKKNRKAALKRSFAYKKTLHSGINVLALTVARLIQIYADKYLGVTVKKQHFVFLLAS